MEQQCLTVIHSSGDANYDIVMTACGITDIVSLCTLTTPLHAEDT